MPKESTSKPSQFIQAAPLLNVSNLPDSLAFYTEQLEFTCDFQSKGYALVWRDNAGSIFDQANLQSAPAHSFFG